MKQKLLLLKNKLSEAVSTTPTAKLLVGSGIVIATTVTIIYLLKDMILAILGVITLVFILFYEQINAYFNQVKYEREKAKEEAENEEASRKQYLQELLADDYFKALWEAFRITPPVTASDIFLTETGTGITVTYRYHFQSQINLGLDLMCVIWNKFFIKLQKKYAGGSLPERYFYIDVIHEHSTELPGFMQADIKIRLKQPPQIQASENINFQSNFKQDEFIL